MESKQFPAFDYVIIKNKIEAGEIIDDDTLEDNVYLYNENFLTVWLQTSGLSTHTNVSGEVQLRSTGDSTISKPLMPGSNTIVFNEQSDVFCVSPIANKHKNPKVPPLDHFSLKAGQSVTLPLGTKLFLASGSLNLGGIIVDKIRQVELVTGARLCTANTDCLGLLFV